MRAISIIYRRELAAYVRSPIGWIITAVLLLVAGILFQALAMTGEQLSAMVLERYFYFMSGVAMAAGILLSIRLIAEDRQTHSIVLLNTSPIRDSEIVLGKFFAALTFLAIMLLLSIYMPLLIKVNGHVTGAQIAVGYLGLFFLGGSALAIGMFASAMAKQQLVAGVVGTAILIVMLLLFQLSKRIDSPVKEVLEQLDLWWLHFQNTFMRGLVTLKDIVYYVAVIYFFLLLSVKTLEGKRWQ